VSVERLAKEVAGDVLMTNTVALGAVLGLVNYDFDLLSELLTEFFNGESAIKMSKPQEPAISRCKSSLHSRKK